MTTLYIDIETVPVDATVGMRLGSPPGWEPQPYEPLPLPTRRARPSHMHRAETVERWERTEGKRNRQAIDDHVQAQADHEAAHWTDQAAKAEAWYRKLSLDPLRCRILCVGLAYDLEEPHCMVSYDSSDAILLTQLYGQLSEARPSTIVAHNGHGFDFPVLQLRSFRAALPALASLFYQDKPWEERLWDTMLKWPGKRYTSLDDIAAFLGHDRNNITCDQVLDRYVADDLDTITAKCRRDVSVLRAAHQAELAMQGRAPSYTAQERDLPF
jgi:uncharacterized protein YprB with RNaseH-like and TPR domain